MPSDAYLHLPAGVVLFDVIGTPKPRGRHDGVLFSAVAA